MDLRIQSKIAAAAFIALAAFAPAQNILKERLVTPPDPIGYYDRVQQAQQLFGAQKFTEAIPLFERITAEYRTDGSMWIYLGHARRYVGKHKEAVEAFQKGLELNSIWQPHRVLYFMAQAQLGAGDKEGAYKSLERMLGEGEWVAKPSLIDDAAFASLKDEKRFRELVGRPDTAKMTRDAGWRMDIDYLVSEVKRVNAVYRVQPLPKDFLKIQADLKRDVPKLTDDEIYTGMGKMIATLHQGHNGLWDGGLMKFTSMPFQLYAFPEGIFIIDADEPYKALIGSEVVKIENVPSAEVLRRVEDHEAVESKMEILWGGMQQMTILQVLRGIGVVSKDKTDIRVTLRSSTGVVSEKTIAPTPHVERRKLLPAPNVPAPLFVKNVPRQHWFEALPADDAVFVQVNQISPAPDETMPQFGLRLRKFLKENPVKNLILDVRHNNGGNTSSYTEFLRTLVSFSIQDGNRIYVIIGRGVYSATSNLITDLERLASPVFVGEPSSGTGNQHGDESSTVMPYSGVRAWLTSVRWQLSHPWDRRRSIVPDLPVQLTAKAYFAGQDPALEAILTLVRRAKS